MHRLCKPYLESVALHFVLGLQYKYMNAKEIPLWSQTQRREERVVENALDAETAKASLGQQKTKHLFEASVSIQT